MRGGRVVQVVVVAMLLAGLGPAASASAPAGTDPTTPVVASAPDTSVPWKLSTTEPRPFRLTLSGTGEPSTTTVSAGGEDVRASPSTQVVQTGTTAAATVQLTAEPGLHVVVVTVERDAAPVTTLTYTVWVPGGEPLEGDGDLAGNRWAAPDAASYSDGRRDRAQDAVWFLDDRWARLGFPRPGVQDCRSGARGCLRYWYDPDDGLVQVGDVAIGVLRADGVHLDGHLARGDDWGSGSADYDHALGWWAPGRRVQGRWRWTDADELPGPLASLDLTLHRDGRFALRRTYDDRRVAQRGRYALGRAGALRLSHGPGPRALTLAGCLGPDAAGKGERCVVLGHPALDSFGGGLLVSRR